MSNTIARNFQFNNINRVSFAALGSIRLIQGDEETVTVEGTEEALEHVKISQEGGTIQIRLYTWYDFLFIPRPAAYTIQVKNLDAFSISGSAEMECEKFNTASRALELNSSGSAKMCIHELQCSDLSASSSGSGSYEFRSIAANVLKGSISGSGNYRFGGAADSIKLHISGSGEMDAAELTVKTSEVHISGSGKIITRVSDQLTVHISGAGEVIYIGEPQISQSISGSGKIRHQ